MELIPKFRAWDKEGHRMILPKYLHSIDLLEEQVTERTKCNYTFSLHSIPFDRAKLMQSTGLKDKNGTEIFEGDIIATNSFACIVSFGKYDYFEDDGIKIAGIGFYLGYLNVEPATYSPFETPFLESCEVLGNIYENELDLIMYGKWKSENPELMEGDE